MFSNTLLFTFLIFLPGLTLCACAVRLGVRGILKLTLILLAGIAIPGYVLFGVYLASGRLGYVISELLPFVWGALLAWLLFRMKRREHHLMLRLLIPVGLTFFAALGILSLGFLFGDRDKPFETTWSRFSHPLPPDNEMPLIFAEGLRRGSVPKPMLGDWLTSDRPPLQTDFILPLEPMVRSRPYEYQITAVILQSLWIISVWLILRAFRLSALTTSLVLITTYLSGFVIVNSFFVWPKLLAATYFIAFAIPVFVLRKPGKPTKRWMHALWAFLLTCSLLSHGGSMFALFGILAFILFWRRWLLRGSILTAILVLAIYAPWVAYQKFGDPPGDRLLKYHLAGVTQITNQPLLPTIYDAYRAQSWGDWRWSKQADLLVLFGKYWQFLTTLGFDANAMQQTRSEQFFYLAPAIGFVAIGALGVLLPPKNKEVRAARIFLTCFICILIPTILLLFQEAVTVIHVLSYAMVLMAMLGCILGLRAIVPRLSVVICLAQCVWTWVLYEPDLRGPVVAMKRGRLNLNLAALLGLIAMLVLATSGHRWRGLIKNTRATLQKSAARAQ